MLKVFFSLTFRCFVAAMRIYVFWCCELHGIVIRLVDMHWINVPNWLLMFPCDGLMLVFQNSLWYIMDICGLWSVSLNPSTLLILKVCAGNGLLRRLKTCMSFWLRRFGNLWNMWHYYKKREYRQCCILVLQCWPQYPLGEGP